MSGIAVSEDAVNLYYHIRSKSAVRLESVVDGISADVCAIVTGRDGSLSISVACPPSQYQWALWRIDDEGSNVIIAAVGSQGSTYSDFIGALPENDCRYGGPLDWEDGIWGTIGRHRVLPALTTPIENPAVYDYQEVTPEGQVLNKLVFLNWSVVAC